ncbi:S8 family serine peptidase [Nocardioides sp.]|uniref:S8 family serine peptidase n=1 Tax=Nocardioides sp. TaxID=35761 RepID=UPI003567ABCD
MDVDPGRMEELARRLNESPAVEGAYVKPPAEPATVLDTRPTDQSASTTANFRSRQHYLDAAPVGIDADYAWSLPGGRGAGVKVIDCEWGWNSTHEDLKANNIGLVGGSSSANDHHGTAVWGEIGGDDNGIGIKGISPDSALGASSFVGQSTAGAIKKAADSLTAGDIILLEIHRRGPNGGGGGQQGYIAIEWWPDDFTAITYAVAKGIIVVEAAGNGWENLDAAVYNTPGSGFPTGWKNPFRLANPSSGAVVVGAGDPPSGTHDRTISPWNQPYVDRARCGFSNWGERVDAQGWGWEVTTTGYGDLQNGAHDQLYTDTFSGTSSASPIVTGALAVTQGVLKAKGMPLMTSPRARTLLRQTGSPQQSATGRPSSQRIGNRPSLKQLIPAALKQWVWGRTLSYCYCLTTSQGAWAFVKDIGWRRLHSGTADGISNMFTVCCNQQSTAGQVNVLMDDRYIYAIMQA